MGETGEKLASGPGGESQATRLLHGVEAGDADAAESLLPLVYDELRAIAGSYFRGQRPDHTLQPTALVHEAYVKLINSTGAQWESSAHFRAVASTAMRQILANHVEARRAAKRGGGVAKREPLDQITSPSGDHTIDVLALHDALEKLAEIDAPLARIVELIFFGGLTLDQTAAVMQRSRSSVARGWRKARALLNTELSEAALA